MDKSGHRRWLRPVFAACLFYIVDGLIFSELAGRAASDEIRTAWRLAAYLTSAAAYAAHVWYEHFQLGDSPRDTALHAALAVALGAFVLAGSANIRAQIAAPGVHPLHLLALLLWPLLTGMPAFAVALVTTAWLARRQRKG